MRVSLHKHEHIEALVREEGPLGSEDVFNQGKKSLCTAALDGTGVLDF
jgi:hypothetical protein